MNRQINYSPTSGEGTKSELPTCLPLAHRAGLSECQPNPAATTHTRSTCLQPSQLSKPSTRQVLPKSGAAPETGGLSRVAQGTCGPQCRRPDYCQTSLGTGTLSDILKGKSLHYFSLSPPATGPQTLAIPRCVSWTSPAVTKPTQAQHCHS